MTRNEPRTLLSRMVHETPSMLWNDSCSIQELRTSIEQNGAVGATCNPVIVLTVLKQEWHLWKDRIPQLIRENPRASDEEVAWKLIEEMSIKAAEVLAPVFERERGRNGRLCIQTNPRFFRNAAAMVSQAEHFATLAPNIMVKIPATRAGIEAMEEATAKGISINATVSFTVPQVLAAAEAVERGLKRREKEGRETASMGPICTLMVGRLDDWLKVVAERKNIIANPCAFEWAGVAVMKRAYQVFKERGYRSHLLSAAFRNHLHWSEFVGGEVVISPPFAWQQRYNNSDVPLRNRMEVPVEPAIVRELQTKFADFTRAYELDGMRPEEFDTYGASLRTLRQFAKATDDLVSLVRDLMVPNPDV